VRDGGGLGCGRGLTGGGGWRGGRGETSHLCECPDDAGVGVEEIIASHAGLAGHSSGDDHQVSALERRPKRVCSDEPTHLTTPTRSAHDSVGLLPS
jgi:hypothetical protein